MNDRILSTHQRIIPSYGLAKGGHGSDRADGAAILGCLLPIAMLMVIALIIRNRREARIKYQHSARPPAESWYS